MFSRFNSWMKTPVWPGGIRAAWLLLVAGLALYILITAAGRPARCGEGAVVPSDFCVVGYLSATNNTGSDLTNYGIHFSYPASGAITAQQLDPRAWDLKSVNSGFLDVEVIAQDLDESSAGWWLQAPSIPDGATITYSLYSGSNDFFRDQGVFWSSAGSTSATVADHAGLRLTNNFRVQVDAEAEDAAPSPSPAWWVSKYDTVGSQGYRFGVVDDGGVMRVRAEIDGTALNSTVEWEGENRRWAMELSGGNLTIYRDEAAVGTTAVASATSTTEDLVLGSGFNGTTRGIRIFDQIDTTPRIVARWGFNPTDMTEVTYADAGPATGTIEDTTANAHDATYTFSWDQTNITRAFLPLSLTTSPQPVIFNPDVLDRLGVGLVTPPDEVGTTPVRFPFKAEIDTWVVEVGWPEYSFMASLFTFFALWPALVLLGVLREAWMGAAAFCFVLWIGPAFGFYPAWYPFTWTFLLASLVTAGNWKK